MEIKTMKILVTGDKGFIGRNLVAELRNLEFTTIYKYDLDSEPCLLDQYTKDCDFIIHLAGVNRPKDEAEFMTGNFGFTSVLLESLKKNKNKAPLLMTSSIQAEYDNPYGRSKKAGEDLVFKYALETGVKVAVYRLPNIFGKWCRPNYNNVVATFCYNIANSLPIKMNDPEAIVKLVYIDDVLNEIIRQFKHLVLQNPTQKYFTVSPVHSVRLGDIVALITSFEESRTNLFLPNMADDFTRKLYSTYLSYLPINHFSYPLHMNEDNRGSFTEIIKTPNLGQVSVNISKPGITKGNHWHQTKCEKFLVVSGNGIVRFRNVDSVEIFEYVVSGNNLEVVDIPPGYTHNIENLGTVDLVTLMWASEPLDPTRPDTNFETV